MRVYLPTVTMPPSRSTGARQALPRRRGTPATLVQRRLGEARAAIEELRYRRRRNGRLAGAGLAVRFADVLPLEATRRAPATVEPGAGERMVIRVATP